MRINSIDNGNKNTFQANIKLDSKLNEMTKYGSLKEMKNAILKSETNNIYELGAYKAHDKVSGSYDILMNSNKIDEIPTKSSDGYFGVVKKFLQKSLDKENSILAEINPEISNKLNQIREFVKSTGLTTENVKKWL